MWLLSSGKRGTGVLNNLSKVIQLVGELGFICKVGFRACALHHYALPPIALKSPEVLAISTSCHQKPIFNLVYIRIPLFRHPVGIEKVAPVFLTKINLPISHAISLQKPLQRSYSTYCFLLLLTSLYFLSSKHLKSIYSNLLFKSVNQKPLNNN